MTCFKGLEGYMFIIFIFCEYMHNIAISLMGDRY